MFSSSASALLYFEIIINYISPEKAFQKSKQKYSVTITDKFMAILINISVG